jgi:hypothetical protein
LALSIQTGEILYSPTSHPDQEKYSPLPSRQGKIFPIFRSDHIHQIYLSLSIHLGLIFPVRKGYFAHLWERTLTALHSYCRP